jgi:opacity protein-like surface antigen
MKVMPSRLVTAILAVLLLAQPAFAAAEEPAKEPAKTVPRPFDRIGWNLVDSFANANLGFQIAGVAATSTMSSQDVDVGISRYFHNHPLWGRDLYPVIIAGVAGPVVLFGGLHIAGRTTGNPETLGASYAVFQAGARTTSLPWRRTMPI